MTAKRQSSKNQNQAKRPLKSSQKNVPKLLQARGNKGLVTYFKSLSEGDHWKFSNIAPLPIASLEPHPLQIRHQLMEKEIWWA